MDLVPKLFLHHLELLRRERVRVHVRVHRWEKVDGHEGRQGAEEGGLRERAGQVRREQRQLKLSPYKDVVADAACDLGESVGRAGSDEDDVCPTAEL